MNLWLSKVLDSRLGKKIMSPWRQSKAFYRMASRFLPHVKKQSDRLILAFLAGIGYVFFGLLEPWPMKLIFDNVFYDEPLPPMLAPLLSVYADNKKALLGIFIASTVAIVLCRGIFYYYQQLLTSRAGQLIVSAVRVDLYSHLQSLSFKFHDLRHTGDMIARLTTDIRILRDILVSLPLNMSSELLLMLAMLGIMAFLDWKLTLITLLVVPILFLLMKKYRSPMKREMHKQREREGQLTTIASEVLGAIKVVQGFHQETNEVERFSVENKHSLKSGLRATRLEAKLKFAAELSVVLITALVLGFAGWGVLNHVLSPGDLLVFMFYLRAFNRPLRRISKTTEQMARGVASGERVLGLIAIEPEIRTLPGAKKAPRFHGGIAFKNVQFEYRPGKKVLSDVSLEIKPGEKIAIIGPTGSGKSTLVSLLPRFYDVTSGQILIDSTDIRSYTLPSLRKQISVVFQEPVLFGTSVAENIAYGRPDATLKEIVEASKKAHIHEHIEAFADGYDTVIGERGCTLSGGQRQCIAIARALIKNAPIVILDEPTTGMDNFSAQLVMEALRELTKDKTVLVISHQAETLREVDRVLCMKHGRLVEEMTPELFWKRELWKMRKGPLAAAMKETMAH